MKNRIIFGEICIADIWMLASIWIGLALFSTFISVCLGIATALSEIIVGIAAQAIIVCFFANFSLGTQSLGLLF